MGKRIVAYIFDAAIVVGIMVAYLAATKSHTYTGIPSDVHDACNNIPDPKFSGQCIQLGSRAWTWNGSGLTIGYAIGAGIAFLNSVLLQGMTGASIGKMVMSLRVVDAQGQKCGIGRAFIRWIVLIFVDDFPYCFPVVGLVTASVTHPHRRVGDMAASTYVVGSESMGSPVVVAPMAYAGYAPPPGAWGAAPPGAPGWGADPAASQWGAPPAQQPQQPAGWGAPPPPLPPAAAPEQPAQWGAPPPVAPVPMPAPPAAPQQPAQWGAPPAAPPPPPPPPVAPEAMPSGPGPVAPAPPPPAAPAPAPPPAAPMPSSWGAPPPSAPPPPAAPAAPVAPPPPVAPAAPPPPEAQPPAPPAPPPNTGESWWDKAVSDEDEPKE